MAIDTSDLSISIAEGENWHRTISVTVPADQIKAERGAIAQKLAKRLKLPGFRKGKVPSGVIERQYSHVLDQEMIDKVVGQAYKHALDTNELSPISEGQVETINYEPEQDLTFTIGFDVQPEIQLERLSGFKVERPAAAVGAEQVDAVLDRLRDQNAEWAEVEDGKPEDGDLALVTLRRIEEGDEGEERPYQLVLGEGEAIPDVEEAIKTLAIGESGDFVVVFPDDFPNEERRGDEEQLHIEVTGRRVKKLPDADDNFAQKVGDFESLEELRSKIEEDLQKESSDRAEGAVRSQLLDQIVAANPFTVPASMVRRYVDSLLGMSGPGGAPEGVDEEQLNEARERFTPEAERAVKQILVIERVAEQESLRATEDEIDERVEEIAEKAGESPAEVYAKLQKAERLESLEREITERKVFDFLKSQSEITEN